ncbi:MAG: Omp28-related outer membrane protein [Bacteroidetes bacterium]|nr:Omp28-related outer membrane protein [Bacteroidota bacterium]
MKKFFFSICALVFLFSACDELPVEINPVMGPPDMDDTIVIDDQQRQVLIEEFTGVRCVQCPAGSAELKDLLAIHGEQLIAISLHAGEFSPPHPDSEYNFTTSEGDQIINYVGNPIGYPSAVVNRKLFEGEFDLQLGKSLWAGYIGQEKALPPKVRLGLLADYNDGGMLNVDVRVIVDENIDSENVRLSVVISEDDIIDRQTTPEGEDYEYKHQHVFRGMMTNWDGDAIGGPLVAGQDLEFSFSMDFPEADWKADDCHVIAFVHLADADNKEVLQAVEVKMTE